MTDTNMKLEYKHNTHRSLQLKYILILTSTYVLSIIAAPILWTRNVYLVHTIMELICIFIALSTFATIWNTCDKSLNSNSVLGFGFLAVLIFDCFHTYYWIGAIVFDQGYPDLPSRYWIIGRLVEALVLTFFSLRQKEIRMSRWTGLFITVTFSFGISLLVLYYPGIMPTMMTDEGLSQTKIALEYVVIVLSLLSLCRLKNKLSEESHISYRNVFWAILFVIPAELSFTMYNVITNFHNMNGHLLKIIGYYFMYKAVYVSSIEYPYKKLNEAYRELEAKNHRIKEMDNVLNDTLDASPLGILFYDYNGRIKYMNKRLEELLFCDRKTLFGSSSDKFLEMFSTEEHEKSVFKLTYESINNSVNVIRTFRNMKGECIKLSLTSEKIREGILVYFHEAKREQEIKNFHLQTQTILNAVTNSILMIDKDRKIILINEAFKKLFELENTDIIGMDIDGFNEMISFKDKQLPYLLLRGETIEAPLEISITTLRGNMRELLMYAAPIKNVENEVIGAISASTDITEIRKQHHKVQQQEKLAMIGQMAAGIVHEIKNPLATVKGLSQLIKSKSSMDKIKEYAGVINTAIDDASRVVNEFLSFAKPKPVVKTRTSINRIVESMQLITETQCYTKNIKSIFYYSSCPMEITADENKIKQVILNLIENAIAAMEGAEHPELVITTYYNAEKREGVIQVKDNGTGMSAEVLDKLGTPFYTTREKGTGLGLGICYQIMSEHNGRIEVQSEEGNGTTFEVIFTQIEDLI